jgi:drug/metabolite transporter (DMT)-like permease
VQSSVTATTLALVPLITALFAVFAGERITLRSMAGIAVGLVGIVVLFGPESLLAFGDSARGLVAALGASVVFAASLFAMVLVRHHGPIVVATASLVTAALWTLPLAFVIDGIPAAMPDTTVVASIVILGLWNTAAASIMLFALIPRAGATFASYNNYLVPAVAVALGTLFLAEPLTAQSVTGVVLVLLGVAISTARRRVPQPPVAPVA